MLIRNREFEVNKWDAAQFEANREIVAETTKMVAQMRREKKVAAAK